MKTVRRKQTRLNGYKPRGERGDVRRATARQRGEITRWLGEMKIRPRDFEKFYPRRSDSFWNAARSGKWGNCRPTVQDWKDVRQAWTIHRAFAGQFISLRAQAFEISAQTSRLILLVEHFVESAAREVEASRAGRVR